MNSKEYIESGILELFALGELSEQEAKEVEFLIEQYPELREDLYQIELAMESFYAQVKVEPEESTKELLRKRIAQKSRTAIQPNWIIAASISLFILSSIAAINFYSKWKATSGQLLSLQNENLRIAEDLNQVRHDYEALDNTLAIVNNAAFKRITLAGTDNAPYSQATVYWNPSTNDLYFDSIELSKLSENQQYQLWAIIDGYPVDIGLVSKESVAGLQQMQNFDGTPTAFAITIEPLGGSQKPSLETMQVIGNISA